MPCTSRNAQDHQPLEVATDFVSGAPVLLALGFALLSALEVGSAAKGFISVAAGVVAFCAGRCAIWNIVCRLGGHEGCFVFLLSGKAASDSVPFRSVALATATLAAASAVANSVLLMQLFGA